MLFDISCYCIYLFCVALTPGGPKFYSISKRYNNSKWKPEAPGTLSEQGGRDMLSQKNGKKLERVVVIF